MLKAKSKKELKSHLMKVKKESEKVNPTVPHSTVYNSQDMEAT